jgi:hypothetical protein
MSRAKRMRGEERLIFLGEEEAAKIAPADLIPVYRVRYGQRRFMAYVKRRDSDTGDIMEELRGAKEILFEGDEVGGNGEMVIERFKTDA